MEGNGPSKLVIKEVSSSEEDVGPTPLKPRRCWILDIRRDYSMSPLLRKWQITSAYGLLRLRCFCGGGGWLLWFVIRFNCCEINQLWKLDMENVVLKFGRDCIGVAVGGNWEFYAETLPFVVMTKWPFTKHP
ncbi:hypothetical protein DVH24_039212 [Malus domestica]|uniref:Uncharacterized protein n=1 Tax=Malus domestica TaxID=3750 RepID=A0A498KBP1_MALDO|nr:hypothetical protein DVH24_039212 [Malus domestica]